MSLMLRLVSRKVVTASEGATAGGPAAEGAAAGGAAFARTARNCTSVSLRLGFCPCHLRNSPKFETRTPLLEVCRSKVENVRLATCMSTNL